MTAKQKQEFYQELGKKIQRARIRAGISQERLAKMVGFTRASITNIEAGRQFIPAHRLQEIGVALKSPGLTIGDISK